MPNKNLRWIHESPWNNAIKLCLNHLNHLPSGKRLHNYGKTPCLMGKSTISMAMFNSYVSHYQRVNPSFFHDFPMAYHRCLQQKLHGSRPARHQGRHQGAQSAPRLRQTGTQPKDLCRGHHPPVVNTTLDAWNPINNGINHDKPSINWCFFQF